MKKHFFLLSAIIMLASTTSMAQKKGLLNKLNDKIENAGGDGGGKGSGGSSSMDKDLKKDLESTTLDKLHPYSDSRNVSGIYYIQKPVRIGNPSGNKFKYAQKFKVNYLEGSANEITFVTRYSHEGNNHFEPIVYYPKPGTPDYFPVTNSKKMGHLYIDAIKNPKESGELYGFETNVLTFPESGDAVTMITKNQVPGEEIIQLEEGILVIGNFSDITKANTPAKYKYLQENGTLVVFYKKEKEAVATAMTNAQLWDKIKKFYDPYMKAFNEADDARKELPKPKTGFKDEPKNADLVAACKARMKEMPYYPASEELVYCYPVTDWENRFEYIGVHGKTLTHRVMQVQVVFKDGNSCKQAQFLIRQDNTYNAGSNAEKFTGNKVFCIGDQQKEDIDCKRAMKFKK